MRTIHNLNKHWTFTYHDGTKQQVNVPHTWNNLDGQDGGDDYYRGTCTYETTFLAPAFGARERVYLQFDGVNASARVLLNGQEIMTHDGGYSTFRKDEPLGKQKKSLTLQETFAARTVKSRLILWMLTTGITK